MQRKGISLIVLVITIIVMIILATAIILSLNNAGIIGNANKAVDETNMDTIKAEADLKYAEYLINNSVIGENETVEAWLNEEIQHEGYVIRVIDKETVVLKEDSLANAYLDGTIKKGDYVTYKATDTSKTENVNQYTLDSENNVVEGTTSITISGNENWRVLGIDSNGELLLTLENTTAEQISLAGKEGYFNGEQILHGACSVFGKGEHATGARSITREDIDKITNVDYSNRAIEIGYMVPSTIYLKYGTKVTTGASENKFTYYNIEDIAITDSLYHLGNSINQDFTNEPFTFIPNRVSYKIEDAMDRNYIKTTDNIYKTLFVNSEDNSNLEYYMANNAIRIWIDMEMPEDWGPKQGIEYGMSYVGVNQNENYMGSKSVVAGDKDGHTNIASSLNLKPVVSIDKNTGYAEATTKINEVATWTLK